MHVRYILSASTLSLLAGANIAAAASVHVTQEGPGSIQIRSESHSNVQIQNGQVTEDSGESTEIRRIDGTTGVESVQKEEWRSTTANGETKMTVRSNSNGLSTRLTRDERISTRIKERIAKILERVAERRARRLTIRSAMDGVQHSIQMQTQVSGWRDGSR
jgi:hypothetical protein